MRSPYHASKHGIHTQAKTSMCVIGPKQDANYDPIRKGVPYTARLANAAVAADILGLMRGAQLQLPCC